MPGHIPGILMRASSSSIDAAVFRNGPFSSAAGVSASQNNGKLSETPQRCREITGPSKLHSTYQTSQSKPHRRTRANREILAVAGDGWVGGGCVCGGGGEGKGVGLRVVVGVGGR